MDRLLRLREGELTDVELRLLDSAMDDTPVAGAAEECLALFGVAAGSAASAASAAALGSRLAGGVRVGFGAGAKGTLTALSIVKWAGMGAVAGTLLAGGVVATTVPLSPPRTVVSRAAPSPASQLPRGAVAPNAGARGPSAGVPLGAPAPHKSFDGVLQRDSVREPGPNAPTSAGGAGAPVSDLGGDAPAPVATSVVAEVASLDAVRSALGADDARLALARLDAYERRFPAGTLEPECVVLRVRALRDLGQNEEAFRVAKAFIVAHPGSAQAAWLKELVSR